jgi:hypothetical protein
MSRIFVLVLILLTYLAHPLRGQDRPIPHFNYMLSLHQAVDSAMDVFLVESIQRDGEDPTHQQYLQLLASSLKNLIAQTESNVRKQPGCFLPNSESQRNPMLKRAMLDYLTKLNRSLRDPLIHPEEIRSAPESLAYGFEWEEKRNEKYDQLSQEVAAAARELYFSFNRFTNQYQLEWNPQRERDLAEQQKSEVLGYTNRVMEICLHVGLLNARFLDLYNQARENPTPTLLQALRRERSELLKAASMGLNELQAGGEFDRDRTYFEAAEALLNFYRTSATQHFPLWVKIAANEDLSSQEIEDYNAIAPTYGNQWGEVLEAERQARLSLKRAYVTMNE